MGTETINKTICGYPWLGAAIRPNGKVIPCCQFAGPSAHVNDPNFRDSWQQIREDMLEGKPILGCDECYQKENSGFKSIRLSSLEYYVPTDSKVLPLVQLEVAFNNLCNLACVHCNSNFSTKWYSEDVTMGRSVKIGVTHSQFDFKSWDLKNLKSIKLIGGEPLMSQDLCIELLEQCDLKNIRLFIATNGTILMNDRLKDLVSQCENITIAVSLDSIDSINDWYRWPGKFDDVISVMRTYDDWWKGSKNYSPRVHPVISAYNVMYIDEYTEFMATNFPDWLIDWDWIRVPEWQTVSVLPHSVKQKLIATLSNPITVDRLRDIPSSSWDEFKNKTLALAKERNLEFFSMVNKFTDIWDLNDTE